MLTNPTKRELERRVEELAARLGVCDDLQVMKYSIVMDIGDYEEVSF